MQRQGSQWSNLWLQQWPLSGLQSRTRRRRRAAAAAGVVPQRGWSAVVIYPAEVQLPKGTGGRFPTYRSSIDTFASMTGTLKIESF